MMNNAIKSRIYDQQIISTSDDVEFPTIASAVNTIMRLDMKACMRGYFTPKGLDKRLKFWFPQLEYEGLAQTRGWHNILSEDGMIITEYNDDIMSNMANPVQISTEEFLNYDRVTYAKIYSPTLNKKAYKFIGVFNFKGVDNNNVRTYAKISDIFDANKHMISKL